MTDIKTLTVDGTSYYIKDEKARKVLQELTGKDISSEDNQTHSSILARIDSRIPNDTSGKVDSAANADHATLADNANNANEAKHAGNADKVGGITFSIVN